MPRNRIPGGRRRAAVLLLVLTSACSTGVHPSGHPRPAEGELITTTQIQRRGARNALELLKWSRASFGFVETATGEIAVSTWRGGLRAPLVVVDGVPTIGLEMLVLIPATEIATLLVLDSSKAFLRYGSRATGGAIVIETKRARR